MNTPSRRHHFVPRVYLSAFTSDGTKNGRLAVLNKETGESFSTTPQNVAAERDFNRVDVPRQPIDALENALARFEADLAPVLLRTRTNLSYPNKNDFNFLINFIAHIAVRNPQSRRLSGEAFQQMRKTFWEVLLSDENIFNAHIDKVKQSGQPFDMTFEETKEFLQKNPDITKFQAQEHTKVELSVYEDILQLFGNRHWSLVLAPSNGSVFISSDYPIGFHFKKPSESVRFVGYGLPHTEVFFPISPQRGLLGVFEDPYPRIVHATVEQVATFNSWVMQSADRQVFSMRDRFLSTVKGQIVKIQCAPIN